MPTSNIFPILLILVILHVAITWLLAIRRGQRARQNEVQRPQPATEALTPASIIVPAWNEYGTIEGCVQSLKTITYPEWEAIILAGGQDGTYEATLEATAGDDRFKVLERGPEPKNVVLTRGIEAAQHDILVLLDADSIVAPDWLNMLVAPLEAGTTAASYGFYLPKKWTWISTEEYMLQIQYHTKNLAVFPGCASEAIWREALEKAGSLTAEAYSWEDWDVYARLVNSNQHIVAVPQATLLTDRPKTLSDFWVFHLRAFRTHLAGLWYHRAIAIRHPFWAFQELLFLGFGAALCLAMIAGVVAVVVQPALTTTIALWTGLLTVWIFGRRAALAGEVAAYKGESKWLAWGWAPMILTFVRILATLYSILTVWRQPSFDYKGPRVLLIEQTQRDGASSI